MRSPRTQWHHYGNLGLPAKGKREKEEKHVGREREHHAQGYDAFNRGDLDTVMGLMDPNIEWQEPDVEGLPLRGTHHGLEDVANNVFGATGKNWDDFQAVPEEFLDVGDRVIMLRHFQGRRKATGRTLDTPFAHVWTLRDGKLVHHRNYVDTAKVLQPLA